MRIVGADGRSSTRIEIEMGKSFREQMTALELGKADLVEVAPEQAHQFSQYQFRGITSRRIGMRGRNDAWRVPRRWNCWRLCLPRDAASPDEKLLREALALSVERGSIKSVLLQGAGQPAASILPNWMSGYGFVFRTRQTCRERIRCANKFAAAPTWTIGYGDATRWTGCWPSASHSTPKMRDCRCNPRRRRLPICGWCEFRWRRLIRGSRWRVWLHWRERPRGKWEVLLKNSMRRNWRCWRGSG